MPLTDTRQPDILHRSPGSWAPMSFDRLKRRDFITLLGGVAATWPLAARAQQAGGMRRIGVLMGRPAGDAEGQKQAAALRRGLEELGWVSPRNIEIDTRWQTDDPGQRQAFARELVELKPDILVVNTTPALVAAEQATATIPIVFVAVADPVEQGFVRGLARPGGRVTGFAAEEPSMGENGWSCSEPSHPASDGSPSSSTRARRRLPRCFCRRCSQPARRLRWSLSLPQFSASPRLSVRSLRLEAGHPAA